MNRSTKSLVATIVVGIAVVPLMLAQPAILSDPNYKEGFGKDTTGGAGQQTCNVTSGAATGAGTFDSCFSGNLSNKTITFSVPTFTLPGAKYINSNVTIDGCAGGANGVFMDTNGPNKPHLVIEGRASNVIVRCINFLGLGTPNSHAAEFDNLTVDGTGGLVSNIFIDRVTSMQGSDGALDITGNVQNVTVQRSLFYGTAKTMLIKYGGLSNISLHHNVFTRNGERNPQIKGDVKSIDLVNNVVHQNDVPNYPDGTGVSPYGTLFRCGGPASDSPGNQAANVVSSAYVGAAAGLGFMDDGCSDYSGLYLAGNYCSPASNCAASPKTTPNAIPATYAVTTLPVDQLKTEMLPYVGSPNRSALDQQRLDAVAAALPAPAPSPSPSATPTPNPSPTVCPSPLPSPSCPPPVCPSPSPCPSCPPPPIPTVVSSSCTQPRVTPSSCGASCPPGAALQIVVDRGTCTIYVR